MVKLYHTKSICSVSSSLRSSSSFSDQLSDILSLPKPPERKGRQKKKTMAVCITEENVVEEMKVKEQEKLTQECAKAERSALTLRGNYERSKKKKTEFREPGKGERRHQNTYRGIFSIKHE